MLKLEAENRANKSMEVVLFPSPALNSWSNGTTTSGYAADHITEEFKNFATRWNFLHATSSLHYPQSNGMSECYIQTMKKTLKKAAADKKDLELVLLETHSYSVRNSVLDNQKQQKYYYDKHASRTKETPLSGAVRVQTSKGWVQVATIFRSADRPCSYVVKMPNGKIVERSENVLCSYKTNGRKSMYCDDADIEVLEGRKTNAITSATQCEPTSSF
ncbi:hypothetical protein PR048_026661 [Dryococelus australis]|uniref:Integrase catalytic domain-containing protein n=1 Tax=Dryococelus australis TaxID=614101 RepID=A0ABQ9GLZ7_9NEOP|nr:hypothetical protein PR048_026661 [Dryococelus australis]